MSSDQRESQKLEFQRSFTDVQKAAIRDSFFLICQIDSPKITPKAGELIKKVTDTLGMKPGHPDVESYMPIEEFDDYFEIDDPGDYIDRQKLKFITDSLNSMIRKNREYYVSMLHLLMKSIQIDAELSENKMKIFGGLLVGMGISITDYQMILNAPFS